MSGISQLSFVLLTALLVCGCDSGDFPMFRGNDAPMFRGNLARTGVYKTKGVEELTNLKWEFKTEDKVWSSPAVPDGVVYCGSQDDNLYAVTVEVAAAFVVGRKDVIPEMFEHLLKQWEKFSEVPNFAYYLLRHLEIDKGKHGPLAERLLTEVAGTDDRELAIGGGFSQKSNPGSPFVFGWCSAFDLRRSTPRLDNGICYLAPSLLPMRSEWIDSSTGPFVQALLRLETAGYRSRFLYFNGDRDNLG